MHDQFITAGGHRLKVRLLGDIVADAPTLVFLHDGIGCIDMWQDFPAQIGEATGLAVVMYDRLGYGGSDPLPAPKKIDYREDEARALIDILDALDIGEAILIGHSDGGAIGFLAAARYPERVRAIVGIAPHLANYPNMDEVMTEFVARFEKGRLRKSLEAFHGENTDGMFYGWADAWGDPAFAAWQMSAEIAAIRCPILFLGGAEDDYGVREGAAELERMATAPHEVVLLPGLGHVPYHEDRDATLKPILAFLDRVLAAVDDDRLDAPEAVGA